VGIAAGAALDAPVRHDIEAHGVALRTVATEAAAAIDGAAHDAITSATDPAFLKIRTQLRVEHSRHKLESPLLTLKPSGDGTAFVVMTNPTPFVGDPYDLRPEMEPAFAKALPTYTGLYGDAHGRWVTGYGPIVDGERVVGLVEADRPADDLHARRVRGRLLAALAALLVGFLASGLLHVLQSDLGVVVAIRRLVRGNLAVRLGLAGAIPVVLGVGVVSSLQVRQARQEATESVRNELLHLARVAAPRVDAVAHAAVVDSRNTDSPAFVTVRDELRAIQEQAALNSDVYTLRRDGEQTRFVVMTGEIPFLDHVYELRDGVRATFDGQAGAGVEGPYGDDHGMWISAWAPVHGPDGGVAAVLQLDCNVTAMITAASNQALVDLLFALVAVLLAFAAGGWIAASVARPIREIAGATERIEGGNFDVVVPTERTDEVGALARSVQRMAGSLAEKERLRNMFGKYMAREVVRDLLEKDELSLEGELVDVTVLLTDIRGYTALTEELGATEVVGLLNEYFGILVDAVLENEGVIDKFMGDALLGWFGAPVPKADHAARAVRTAIAVLERSAQWNKERVAKGLRPVTTGIGLASGKVVVGNIGSQQRLEYTAIGDAVNLASRLCSKAEAGEILATKEVAQAGGDFECGGEIEVKGVSEPVAIHRLRRPLVAE